ncbi:hypothetical protein EYR36_010857 [Pleurotus pulmonarius]|nr:hypothetical protein EYR36_010857 [Pleurotus pulmonarius]
MTLLTSRMPMAATSDEYLPLHSPPSPSPSFSSAESTPAASPRIHGFRHKIPSLQEIRARSSGALPLPVACRHRRFQSTFLVLIALIGLSAYIIFLSTPTLRTLHSASGVDIAHMDTQPIAPKHRQQSGKAHHGHHVTKNSPSLPIPVLTPALELAAITSFLTSIHDAHMNMLPPTVDPSKTIDPQLVLDFDITRNPRAKEELQSLQENVWSRNPVVLYAKHFSPLSRAIKGTLEALHMNPPPTFIDVDTRADASILEPLLRRLTGMDLPIILIAGQLVRPVDDGDSDDSASSDDHLKVILDAGHSHAPTKKFDTSVLEYLQELESNGELAELLEKAGLRPFRQMAPTAEYVIFDMDGESPTLTLHLSLTRGCTGLMIDSERVYTDVTNEILSEYGKEMTWDIKAGCMGKPERQAAEHLLSFFPGISLTIDEYLRRRDELQDLRWPKVQLLPGVQKLVKHLHAHSIPIAVATGSRRRNFTLKTQHLGDVFDCFEGRILCADDHVSDGDISRKMKGKPAPDVFIWAARTLLGRNVGDPDADCAQLEMDERSKGLVFEDALPGMQAGKRAGMAVVWVPDANLLNVEYGGVEKANIVLKSLEDFVPEHWGLPPSSSVLLKFTNNYVDMKAPPPWLSAVHRSTTSPSQGQRDDARRGAERAGHSLTLLEAELQAAESYIVHVREARRKVQEHFAQYKTVLAPIRRIPSEILAEIFVATIDDARLCDPLDNDEMPWLLGRVCHSWKLVSESTPKLWSRIRVELKFVSPLATRSRCLIHTFIQRAAQHPLKLQIDFSYHDAHPIINLLTACSPQWEDVSMTLMNVSTWTALSPIRARIPMLRRLTLKLGYIWCLPSSPSLSPSPDHFSVAPNLRYLDIDPFFPLRIPWNQLARLTTHSPYPCNAWCIFALACNVVEGDISISMNQQRLLPPAVEARLPFMRTLTLRSSCDVIQYLSMPLIREIWLVDISLPNHSGISIPSYSTLRTLVFIRVTMEKGAYHRLLQAAVSVVQLVTDTNSTILDALDEQPGRLISLPHLKHLVLHGPLTRSFHSSLLRLLHSRLKLRHQPPQIESLSFITTGQPTCELQASFSEYAAKGMKIYCDGVWPSI